MAEIIGTTEDDTLQGTPDADTVTGLAGDDRLIGSAGNDTLDGGAGADTADYAAGAEGLFLAHDGTAFTGSDGQGGTDSLLDIEAIEGTSAADIFDASLSTVAHRLDGGGEGDLLVGGSAGDALSGEDGTDTLVGGAGGDTLSGGADDDILLGGADADTLSGGEGADYLVGGDGADSVDGGDGNDEFESGAGNDTLVGGAGEDLVSLGGSRSEYTVTNGQDGSGSFTEVRDNVADGGDDGTDRIYGVESLVFLDGPEPICFMPGTLVAVPGGERAVETLAAGDLVLTADGRAAPVCWLGRQTVSTRFADPLRVLPVRITAGALGEGLPKRDLLVSPDHALLLDGALVQAGALVNGATVRREAGVPEVFAYWHVELAGHALVLAEGVPAESFVDNVARLAFDNWAEHEAAAAAAGPAPPAEMALPRAKSARQVPVATRRRLAERAAALLGAEAAA